MNDDNRAGYKALDVLDYINVEYSTINKRMPNMVSIDLKGWANVKDGFYFEDCDFEKIKRRLTKNIKSLLFAKLEDSLFDRDKIIVTLQWPVNGFTGESFVGVCISLYQTNGYAEFLSEELKKEVTYVVYQVKELFEEHIFLNFKKRKGLDLKDYVIYENSDCSLNCDSNCNKLCGKGFD